MRVGKSFAFPLQALSSPLSFFDKKHPLFPYVEVPSRKKEIEEATSFITSLPLSSCRPLLPIYTPADLNCLLHGLMIGINGVKDGVFAEKEEEKVDSSSRTILRDALYDNLHSCEALISRIAPTADRMLELLKDASQVRKNTIFYHNVYFLCPLFIEFYLFLDFYYFYFFFFFSFSSHFPFL